MTNKSDDESRREFERWHLQVYRIPFDEHNDWSLVAEAAWQARDAEVAELREALQGFVDTFEKADGNVLAIVSKEMIERAKALANTTKERV